MLPTDNADALDWLAFEQAGVLTTAQATRCLSEGVVRGRIRSGRWRSICRGIVLTGNGRLTRDQHLWLDAYWRKWRVQAEIDGAHHMTVRQWAADMRRQNDVWTSGDRILRFPAWLVRARPEEVAETVRRALIAAGWTPELTAGRTRV